MVCVYDIQVWHGESHQYAGPRIRSLGRQWRLSEGRAGVGDRVARWWDGLGMPKDAARNVRFAYSDVNDKKPEKQGQLQIKPTRYLKINKMTG